MADKVTVTVGEKKLNLILGRTVKQWEQTYDSDSGLWDFPIEELLDGTVEINEDIYYWLISGRCFETDEEV